MAIHDSELTRALESVRASGSTPSGPGTTGFEWWPTDWHYFVMPESVKEALRSDGTAFTVVSDASISAGLLLSNGRPLYPIVISLAAEAMRDNEIAPLTNYVAAGGFLLIGSSAFTRYTDGRSRGDFAFADQMGMHMSGSGLDNWLANNYFSKRTGHRLVDHIPSGTLTWRMAAEAEEISWGTSPNHPFIARHAVWDVRANGATVLASGDVSPYLLVKPFGKGYFIYYAAFQPLIGHGGFAPSMYAYVIFRKAIEWAFESAMLPLPRLSPWPYAYDAAFMVRHDLENYPDSVANIEASAQYENARGAKGDYYFCTGTLREDMVGIYNTAAVIESLRRAVANYDAVIGPHNGGLRNPNNPSLGHGSYDYWHWGPDEALDVTPSGYASGKAYAQASIASAFQDIEYWLAGVTSGTRAWVAPYFNATREDSYDLQSQLNIRITGDQKLTPFPHWTLSTRTAGKRYASLSEPVSDWFVGGLVAQSLEPWHPPGVQTVQTLRSAIDFYYNLGALINFYSHTLSTGQGDAGQLASEYVTYSMNRTLHPRLWAGNAEDIYQWWLKRSDAQVNVSYYTNGALSVLRVDTSGAKDSGTALEFLLPGTSDGLRVMTNNVMAAGNSYRINGQLIKVCVGSSVTNVILAFYPPGQGAQVFAEDFDGVTAPGLPTGWTTTASGAQSAWVTQASVRDSVPNAAFSTEAANVGISELVSPPIVLPQGQFQLAFRNYYNLETGPGATAYDGGVLEIKIGSGSFADIVAAGGNFMSGGYTHTITNGYSNPLAGRLAWSGNSGGFLTSLVDLPTSIAGQTVQLRWRCATDNGTGSGGWRIDSVAITNYGALVQNHPPILLAPPNVILNELTLLRVTNTAMDLDVPDQALSYRLLAPPAGATIDSRGVITWTPTEAQGPGTNVLTTVVTDNGDPALSDTNSFSVVAAEVNSAPVLPVQTNRVIPPMTLLVVTNKATDTDLPANPLGYTLASGPAGAAIDAKGVVTWTPTQAQNNTTNTFTTVVTDSNGWAAYAQQLSATNSFVVVVTSSQRMVLDGTTLVTEECQPANHAIDPGETVTVLFGLKNIGTASTTNLVARLLAGNGVVLPSS
ncbi:MAG TPA: hypothetical protein VNT26_16260, partial [Candidatus Sulfotelmatobacter sp.]|nr:hypothetical protein [Candidatus Sulfotelmatobacter sp.]